MSYWGGGRGEGRDQNMYCGSARIGAFSSFPSLSPHPHGAGSPGQLGNTVPTADWGPLCDVATRRSPPLGSMAWTPCLRRAGEGASGQAVEVRAGGRHSGCWLWAPCWGSAMAAGASWCVSSAAPHCTPPTGSQQQWEPGAWGTALHQEAGCGEPAARGARLPGKCTAPLPPSLSLLASLLGTFPSRSRCPGPGAAPRGNLREGVAGACASPALPAGRALEPRGATSSQDQLPRGAQEPKAGGGPQCR